VKSRILIIFAGLIGLWLVLLLRAGYLQAIPNVRLHALQERQFQTVVTLQSRRGAILDRKGRELALSTTAFSLFADPKLLEEKRSLARRLAKELGMTTESVYSKIKDKDKRFIWIARQLDKEKADVIKSWDIRGLSFVEEFRRVYPNETLLAHTLGMIGAEGQGLEGLELQYDQQLRGSKTKISLRRDARGRPLIADGMMFVENPDGAEVRLTIDSEMQHMLEGELDHAVDEFGADQAFGVILDAQTSAVLAMVNTPNFDANKASRLSLDVRRNRVLTDTFEPGSTMKTFAIATALREKIIAPNSKYNTENGTMRIGDRIIHDAEATHANSHLSVSEILAVSSNIGVTKIAFDLGAQALRQGLLDFGFGSKSGLDFPGDAKGSVQPLPWNQHLLSNISFGQGVSVTPMQLANAYAAIANGGVLNTPYVVQSLRDPDSGELVEFKPKTVRRVLTPQVAESMRMMLVAATSTGGTGENANVDGFLVGGKTGTAQKVNPNGRGYLNGAFVSSFAGFIPASDPKFVIYIAVDHPKKLSHFGAAVAAPVFSRVASYSVRMEGLAPLLLTEKNLLPGTAFKVTEATHTKAKKKKDSVKKVQFGQGSNTSIVKEARVPATAVPNLLTASDLLAQADISPLKVMPELKNQSLREVLRKFSGQEVEIRFVGTGVVSSTEPVAGKDIPDTKKVTVYLKNL
jgi:cell division protein FtsI (penicillin-binding protein 3)